MVGLVFLLSTNRKGGRLVEGCLDWGCAGEEWELLTCILWKTGRGAWE